MHETSHRRMAEFAADVRKRFADCAIRILDVGSLNVNGSYRNLFGFDGAEYVGLDMEWGPNVDVVPRDPYDWLELADNSFDIIISGQALEHVEFPWLTMEQIARKLKTGGFVCLIAPSSGPEHRYPKDCYRYYPDGMCALAHWAGLSVVEADYRRVPSGFRDGSDVWADCHCILTKAKPDLPLFAQSDAVIEGGHRPTKKAGERRGKPALVHDFGDTVLTPASLEPVVSSGAAISGSKSEPPISLPQSAANESAGVSAHEPANERIPRHLNNPLDKHPGGVYYSIERRDVIEVMKKCGITANRALELGCGTGATGKRLKEDLNIDFYVGIEASKEAAEAAKSCLDRVCHADIEHIRAEKLGLGRDDFDLLLALDVLEHLYDPWLVLTDLAGCVCPTGHVVLCLPNVGNLRVLEHLAAGRWPYSEAGLLDVTHTRFFTLEGIRSLVAGAGLKLIHITNVLNPTFDEDRLKDAGNRVKVGKVLLSDLTRADVIRLMTYQYIIIAQRERSFSQSCQ